MMRLGHTSPKETSFPTISFHVQTLSLRKGNSWEAENGSFQSHFSSISLVFQIPCEDRCLDLQTPPEKAFSGPNTDPHKV